MQETQKPSDESGAESTTATAPNRVGEVLRGLMVRRGVNGRELASAINLSAQSVSSLVNGRARPRQGTLGKLMRVLCATPADEQALIAAYEGSEPPAETPAGPDAASAPTGASRELLTESGTTLAEEMERAARYLEIKALSVGFEEDVAALLRQAAIPFERNVRHGAYIAEFIARPHGADGPRVVIECKFNVNRDWERTRATALLLKRHMPCDRVVIVAPYLNELGREWARRMLVDQEGDVVAAGGLVDLLRT